MIPENEYHPYFKPYIEELSKNGKSIIENLIDSKKTLNTLLSNIPENKKSYAYAEGKWTVKEIMQHLIDTERIFNYRALRFARNDQTDLVGFDQDEYIQNVNANSRNLDHLIAEFNAARDSSILLFQSFSNDVWKRVGSASGNIISVRAIGYLISGHQLHHLKVFQERYL